MSFTNVDPSVFQVVWTAVTETRATSTVVQACVNDVNRTPDSAWRVPLPTTWNRPCAPVSSCHGGARVFVDFFDFCVRFPVVVSIRKKIKRKKEGH